MSKLSSDVHGQGAAGSHDPGLEKELHKAMREKNYEKIVRVQRALKMKALEPMTGEWANVGCE